MRNFIKYSKLKLRSRPESCTPVGPNFDSAREVKVNLAGTLLEFRAPRHSPLPNESIPQLRANSRRYEFGSGDFINPNCLPSESWRHTAILSRKWGFYGPWFTGHMGQVSGYLEVIQLARPSGNANFLHPKALESASLAYITALLGHEVYDEGTGETYETAPLNWSTVKQLDCPNLQFDSENTFSAAQPCRHIFIPISRSHIARLALDIHQSAAGSREEVDRKVSPEPFKCLVNNIVDSIKVTLSPEAQADLEDIKRLHPGARVSETCPPLKWPADVGKDGLTILEYKPKRYASIA